MHFELSIITYNGNGKFDANNSKLICYSKSGDIKGEYLPLDECRSKYLFLFETISLHESGVYFFECFNDTVYAVEADGVRPKYFVDFGDKAINNFREYTILNAYELSEFVGFTEQEVKPLCEQYNFDFDACKHNYDGYAQNGYEIYNPEAVVQSVLTGEIGNFWGKTSTYSVISDRLKSNFDGMKNDVIRMIAGENIKVNVTRYMNTMTDFITKDDVFTYLIHVGYLAFNNTNSTCRIPNLEVRKEWYNAIESLKRKYSVTNKIIKDSEMLLEQTIQKNSAAVAAALDRTHIHVTSNRSYNNEDALQSAIYLAFIDALNYYTVIKEMTTGKGFADVVYIPVFPNRPAMIVELKRNDSTESALNQIKERKYFDSLEHYKGKLLFVGINYDEENKTHECEITEWEK